MPWYSSGPEKLQSHWRSWSSAVPTPTHVLRMPLYLLQMLKMPKPCANVSFTYPYLWCQKLNESILRDSLESNRTLHSNKDDVLYKKIATFQNQTVPGKKSASHALENSCTILLPRACFFLPLYSVCCSASRTSPGSSRWGEQLRRLKWRRSPASQFPNENHLPAQAPGSPDHTGELLILTIRAFTWIHSRVLCSQILKCLLLSLLFA